MPKIKNKEDRFKILNECLRDPHREYTYESLLAELNRQLAFHDLPRVAERTLKVDIEDMKNIYGIELDEELAHRRPVILRYADLTDTINKLSMEEANALRKTIDMLLQCPEPRPIQYEYMRVCLQQILKNQVLNTENPAVRFSDNLDHEGRDFFVDLCNYIFEKQPIAIKYRPYGTDSKALKVSPYLLKQYNERWFLFAWDMENMMLLTLPLDRIVSVKKCSDMYEPCKKDWEDYFYEIIGVTHLNNHQIETIRLKIKAERYPYIETKPIHGTQTLVKELSTEEYRVIEINVRPNNELESQILSYGDDIEVLGPLWLRDKIKTKVEGMIKNYR